MDRHENGIICTKHRLWKKKQTIIEIVEYFESNGYRFVELVYGEPNDFVFTERKEKIIQTLSRKGSFYGVRIKFEGTNTVFSVDSNTDGIDNVRFDIYAENEELLYEVKQIVLGVKDIIKPSNDSLEKGSEYLQNHPRLVRWVIGILIAVVLYLLGVHVLLFDIIGTIFSIVPFFIIYLVISSFLRRR